MFVGYGPYSSDFEVPGDRRRFVNYARAKGIQFEIADIEKDYDVVYITMNADLPAWIARKKKQKDKLVLIFELIDSYLVENERINSRLRGFVRYINGSFSKPVFNFKKTLKEICRLSDGVVCSTEEQKSIITTLNPNVHISPDIFENDISNIKTDYREDGKLKLVWEGQPYTLKNLLIIKDVLNEISEKIELHIVTDRYYFRYNKKYIREKTLDILNPLRCEIVFHEWKKETFSKIITSCDLALIPIGLKNPFQRGKPENKLILFWQMGLPVIATSTPAYSRVMNKSDVNMHCKNDDTQWKELIMNFSKLSKLEKEVLAKKSLDFAIENYQAKVLYKKWDKLFASVYR